MTRDPIIRASREAFGHEPDPAGSRPFPAWLVMAAAALVGIVPPLVVIGMIAWRAM